MNFHTINYHITPPCPCVYFSKVFLKVSNSSKWSPVTYVVMPCLGTIQIKTSLWICSNWLPENSHDRIAAIHIYAHVQLARVHLKRAKKFEIIYTIKRLFEVVGR